MLFMFLSDKHGLGIGLIDYISTMSNPKWMIENNEWPRVPSWKYEGDLLNFFSQINSNDIDNYSISKLCKTRLHISMNLTNYCKMTENLPSLEVTQMIMNLAKHPLHIKDKMKKNIR